jgi:hypothetical protein
MAVSNTLLSVTGVVEPGAAVAARRHGTAGGVA